MEEKAQARPSLHPSVFEPGTLVLVIACSVFGAIVTTQILARIGISSNTSVIGAVIAMAVGRAGLWGMRSIHRQNLVQTAISAASFGAANDALIAVCLIYLLGQTHLVVPMLIGSLFAAVLDIVLVYRLYDTPVFPACGAWPPGVATARVIQAGDEGGEKARRLLQGFIVGLIGTYFKLPMSAIGIVYIANIWAMIALGVGLLIRGYSVQLFGVDLGKTYIPQGVMLGAGIVQLFQAAVVLYKTRGVHASALQKQHQYEPVVLGQRVEKEFPLQFVLFTGGALVMALVGGLWTQMSFGQLVAWLLYCGFAALTSTILVGLCAMQSGWFPAFAITVIYMLGGIALGFPAVALAFLVGYTASTGPLLADMGYDLHAGWLLRGNGKNPALEREGRVQQLYAEVIGAVIGFVVVFFTMNMFFKLNLFPPITKVYAATIKAVFQPTIWQQMIMWAVPGAVIQAIGGDRAVGILLATGLLINNPIYGICTTLAVLVRILLGKKSEQFMEIRESGLIAGDGVYSFVDALIKTFSM